MASGFGMRQQLGVDLVGREDLQALRLSLLPGPCWSRRRCRRIGILHGLERDRITIVDLRAGAASPADALGFRDIGGRGFVALRAGGG